MPAHQPSCGLVAVFVFLGALVAGTCCSLTSKILMSMQSVGLSGELEYFSYPLFQTFGMFVGMLCGLIVHFVVSKYKIPFPGYIFPDASGKHVDFDGNPAEEPRPVPTWMLFLLIIPSIFDLFATALCMFGLRYVDVSMYQMLRGGAIIFVALLKQFVIGHRLYKYQWIGVFWNVMSIVVVGIVAMLSAVNSTNTGDSSHPLTGVILILLGAFVQSLQYAFEEKVMSMDIPAPPMLLIGMEGLWGTLLCTCFLYPLVYNLPGPDHGSIENPYNTYIMFRNSSSIQGMFVLFFVSVFLYNVLGVLVTCVLNSVWHAILDNFRPVSVWGTDLFIYYGISHAFGETWTQWSYLQLGGMFILLYGTAIYNAPNTGSILLRGQWFACGLDFSHEYDEVEETVADSGEAPPILSSMSPFMTPRTAKAQRDRSQYAAVPLTPEGYGAMGASKQVVSVQMMKKQTSFHK